MIALPQRQSPLAALHSIHHRLDLARLSLCVVLCSRISRGVGGSPPAGNAAIPSPRVVVQRTASEPYSSVASLTEVDRLPTFPATPLLVRGEAAAGHWPEHVATIGGAPALIAATLTGCRGGHRHRWWRQ